MSSLQQNIIRELHVQPTIDSSQTIADIIAFLTTYLARSGANGYVLGISGGQDSTLCGKLAQLAVQRAREKTGGNQTFWALRLPYDHQADEQDALAAVHFINPDRHLCLNIAPTVNACVDTINQHDSPPVSDFQRGNIKARVRMTIQYALAGQHRLLVLGTDHAAESVTGFYTKHGDGAADLTPLTGLTKRQGKQLLQALGAPTHLLEKIPTADLEDSRPLLADELALGVSYTDIDDYLEGKKIAPDAQKIIENWYHRSAHKRAHTATRFDPFSDS